jgi:hypothetical protein
MVEKPYITAVSRVSVRGLVYILSIGEGWNGDEKGFVVTLSVTGLIFISISPLGVLVIGTTTRRNIVRNTIQIIGTKLTFIA